jgi:glycosyltransferase involved in cell wall biosynthesis
VQVSVIIPAYNHGRFLAEAAASVLAQTYGDLEVVVVDDGSTDDTPQVLAAFQDPRLHVIRTRNHGKSAARNRGLDEARGRYIAFLDADDRWRPRKLERQLAVLEQEPDVGLVFCDFLRFDAEGALPGTLFSYVPQLARIPSRLTADGLARVISADTFEALGGLHELPSWLQTVVLRADAVRGLRFDGDLPLCQDLHYMLRVYLRVRAAYVDEVLVDVRRHAGNSYQTGADVLEPRIRALRCVARDGVPRGYEPVLRRRLGRAWVSLGYHHFWTGRLSSAARAYGRALAYPGTRHTALTHLLALPSAPLMRRLCGARASLPRD